MVTATSGIGMRSGSARRRSYRGAAAEGWPAAGRDCRTLAAAAESRRRRGLLGLARQRSIGADRRAARRLKTAAALPLKDSAGCCRQRLPPPARSCRPMSAVLAPPAAAPSWLHGIDLRWRPIVGRQQRPIGMHLAVSPLAEAAVAPLAEVLASVLDGFAGAGETPLPHGLVLLAPRNLPLDASLLSWAPPRNVMLEIPSSALDDERQVRIAAELQRRGLRLVLNADPPPAAGRLPLSFQYVVSPASRPASVAAGSGVLIGGARTRGQVQAAFDNGAHAMIGWPLEEVVPEAPGSLQPVQKAVFELIRLLQAEADAAVLDRAFAADPVLSYLLLTLANSPAFRRGRPLGSITQAITLLGYKRLLKWLVLLLVIASKGSRALPQIYAAVTRGFFIENLAEAAGDVALREDGFVTGAFSLLAQITGMTPERLFDEVALPPTIVRAVIAGEGPAAALLALARALEGDATRPGGDPAVINSALLQALACADALQSLV
jgi:EAL and modified HD-GYP domain-containing signal transduction protein